MTITREQVADLKPGDVVKLASSEWPGVFVQGPLRRTELGLQVGTRIIRDRRGEFVPLSWSLEIIKRAPEPLYVNHERTEPVNGDVVRDADNSRDTGSWNWCDGMWYAARGVQQGRDEMPKRLRLLVDGSTGNVVPEPLTKEQSSLSGEEERLLDKIRYGVEWT